MNGMDNKKAERHEQWEPRFHEDITQTASSLLCP